MWKIQGKVGRPDGFVNAGNVVNVEVEEGAVANVKISFWKRVWRHIGNVMETWARGERERC